MYTHTFIHRLHIGWGVKSGLKTGGVRGSQFENEESLVLKIQQTGFMLGLSFLDIFLFSYTCLVIFLFLKSHHFLKVFSSSIPVGLVGLYIIGFFVKTQRPPRMPS